MWQVIFFAILVLLSVLAIFYAGYYLNQDNLSGCGDDENN